MFNNSYLGHKASKFCQIEQGGIIGMLVENKPHTSSRMIITPIIIILARLCRVNMKPVPGGGSASPAATKTNILIGVGLTSSRHTQWGQQFFEIEFVSKRYSCNNITTTLIQISAFFYFGFFSKMIIQIKKYALNSQLQAYQILTKDDEVKN